MENTMTVDVSDNKALVVGSRDTYKVRIVDWYINQKTDEQSDDAVDLTDYTEILLIVEFSTDGQETWSSPVEHEMTKDADQTNNTGYASYTWAADDLTAGVMRARVKATDGSGLPHYSDRFYEDVEAA